MNGCIRKFCFISQQSRFWLVINVGPWSNCFGLPQNFTPQTDGKNEAERNQGNQFAISLLVHILPSKFCPRHFPTGASVGSKLFGCGMVRPLKLIQAGVQPVSQSPTACGHPDAPHPLPLLRARSQRPRDHRTAK